MSQTLPPAPDFREESLAKALIQIRQMSDDQRDKARAALRQQMSQPKPTNYNLGQQAQFYTKDPTVVPYQPTPDRNAALQNQYQAALRQVVTRQPDYDIPVNNTNTMTIQLHEEILANQTKSYELKLDTMRREIAALNLSLQESRILANTLMSAQQNKNPTTAASPMSTATKTTLFPLNALTHQTQRIGLTTERYL